MRMSIGRLAAAVLGTSLLGTSLLGTSLLMVGCTSASKGNKATQNRRGVWDVNKVKRVLGFPEDPYLTPIPDAPKIYKEGFASLEKQEFEKANETFISMLQTSPTTNWTLAAKFNRARSLEGLGRRQEALEVYRHVAETAKRSPRIQGLALLRMGVLFEANGAVDKSLAALKDAERRGPHLPVEVTQTELPARLAAAYARQRNFSEAERYFRLAELQLARLRSQTPAGEQPEWIPRILYAMGHRPNEEINWDSFESSLIALERSQIFLLQSAELGIDPWSELAAAELIASYAALRRSIDAVPVPAAAEIVIAAREQQRERWNRIVRLADGISTLQTLFVTEIVKSVSEDSPLKKIVNFADDFEESLQSTLMFERPAGEDATPESIRRQVERRPRTLNAKPIFPGETQEDGDDD